MKPKEYIKKYNLDSKNFLDKSTSDQIVADLLIDFISLLEFHKSSGIWNYTKFRNCISEIKQKFDSIRNRVPYIKEGMWNYFYAKYVVKIQDQEFGEYLKEKQRKQREWDQLNTKDYIDGFGFGFFEEMVSEMLNELLNSLMIGIKNVPESSFTKLGLESNCSMDDVKGAYRKLSLEHHPDKGGKSSEFIEVTEAKNRCIAYLEKQKLKK